MLAEANRILLLSADPTDEWTSGLGMALQPFGCPRVVHDSKGLRQHLTPDVALVILDDAATDCVADLTADLRRIRPELRIIVCSISPTWADARRAFRSGAMDYLPKQAPGEMYLGAACRLLAMSPTPLGPDQQGKGD